MNRGEWLKIDLIAPAEYLDVLGDYLFTLGVEGTVVGEQTITGYLPFEVNGAAVIPRLNDYLSELAVLNPSVGEILLLTEFVKDIKWAEDWKKNFRPVRIGRRLIVKPSWEDYEAIPGELVITIDPGMAFGTGQHPTTRMCAEALEKVAAGAFPRGLGRVLDVGCGTGILAIAAAKLGAAEVVGIDLDPLAVEAARDNVRANGQDGIVGISEKTIDKTDSPFEVIVANLTFPLLLELLPEFVTRLKEGGYLIVSGLLAQDGKGLAEGFRAFPLTLGKTITEEEWLCFVWKREGYDQTPGLP